MILLPAPNPYCFISAESMRRLTYGGNCKGTVPVHFKRSSTAKYALYTADQLIVFGAAIAEVNMFNPRGAA